jgi:GntR family transcriptional regulator/MocR family aminotransferase
VLTDFIAEGHFERHLRRARKLHSARREALMQSLRTHFGDRVEICGANAGLHVLAWLSDHADAELPSIVARAAAAGVGIYPVTPYYFEPPQRAGLVLGYSALNPAAIKEGLARFARSLVARKTA